MGSRFVYRVVRGLVALGVFLSIGCDFSTESRPNVLVLAVDSLKFEDIRCQQSESLEALRGFQVLCQEGARFTHAYASSSLAVPSLATLLTGLYPFESGVWNNSESFLPPRVVTTAESAYREGYRTLFVSGGAPVWSQSAINQGFDQFIDGFRPTLERRYRSAQSVLRTFRKWIARSRDPFFAVAYLSDLQFPEVGTQTFEGTQRASQIRGQIEEVDEKLGKFFDWMKSNDRWNNTYVILAGLNGRFGEKGMAWSVFSENTHVALFIKPKRKKRDKGLSWNIDANVSLADVGHTIREIISPKIEKRPHVVSLLPAIRDLSRLSSSNRMVFVESGWPAWQGIGPSVFAARMSNHLYVHDKQGSVYNSLVDRGEIRPIDVRDSGAEKLSQSAMSFFVGQGIERSKVIAESEIDKSILAGQLFGAASYGRIQRELLWALIRKRKNDPQLTDWLAYLAIRNEDWKTLERVGKFSKEEDWGKLAEVRQGGHVKFEDPCLQGPIESCLDQPSKNLRLWMNTKLTPIKREQAREKLIRILRDLEVRRRIHEKNLALGISWFRSNERLLRPTTVDLLLALPENAQRKKLITQRLTF